MKYAYLIITILAFSIISCSENDSQVIEEEIIEIIDDVEMDDVEMDDSDNEESSPKLLTKLTVDNYFYLLFFYNDDYTLDKLEGVFINQPHENFTKQFHYLDGNIDYAEFINPDGTPDGKEEYLYENNIISERRDTYVDEDTGETIVNERFLYTFENENVSKISYIGANASEISNIIEFQYDESNNVSTRSVTYINNQNESSTTEYLYDDFNNPLLNVEPKILHIDDFFSFVNNVIQTTNSFTITHTYTYDDDGFPTKQEEQSTTYEYEYNR